MKVGIAGFSGSGKSLTFTWLTGVKPDPGKAQHGQMGVARIPDDRLDWLSAHFKPKKTTHATLEMLDTPGLLLDERRDNPRRLAIMRDAGALLVVLNGYAGGESERILAGLLPGRRDRIVLATKAGIPHPDQGEHAPLSPAGLRAALDGSLERLGTDHVDLFYLHQPDRRTPLAETLATVAEFVAEGKIRALGVSNFAAWQIAELTRTSHALAEIANIAPDTHQAYVGVAAFAHKAGLHASAIKVDPELYNHMDPTDVGNGQRVLVTEMAGRASVELKAAELGLDLACHPGAVAEVVATVKEREAQGWSFEAADASLELIMRSATGEDARLPFELDADLRPEGRNGVVARSLDAYRAYYARWSLTWEAQALLRARGVAGDEELIRDFMALADTVRYPQTISEQEVREVKRIKARVENERLPQGADPTRHLKLGRGSLSDVEWFVQLVQLQHGAEEPSLRTTSTLAALAASVEHGYIDPRDAETLRAAWVLASRARSALTLWLDRTTDVLPVDRSQLEGVARIMGYPPGSASRLESDYLAVTRRARAVFERGFYGVEPRREPTTN